MKRRRRVAPSSQSSSALAGFRFPPEVIVLGGALVFAVRVVLP
jgi:hypothetical protein